MSAIISLHRYENELAIRQSVEADIAGLKRLLDEIVTRINELILQIGILNADKDYLNKAHHEVMKFSKQTK